MKLLLCRRQSSLEVWPSSFEVDIFTPYKLIHQSNLELTAKTALLQKNDWVIFSSAFAVRCFFSYYTLPTLLSIGVVGKKTKKSLDRYQQQSNILLGSDLDDLLQQIAKTDPTGKIVHPTSYDSLRFIIPQKIDKISLHRYPIYKRQNISYSPSEILQWQLEYDCIFFASPSCVESTRQILGEKIIQQASSFAALGKTTASYLQSRYSSHKIWVPDSPNMEELVTLLSYEYRS